MHEKQIGTTDRETAQSVVTSMKYGGIPVKRLAHHFTITDPKLVQKIRFFRETGRVLWLLDRHATIEILMDAAEHFADMDESEMSDKEIEIRRRIQTGRMDTNGRQLAG